MQFSDNYRWLFNRTKNPFSDQDRRHCTISFPKKFGFSGLCHSSTMSGILVLLFTNPVDISKYERFLLRHGIKIGMLGSLPEGCLWTSQGVGGNLEESHMFSRGASIPLASQACENKLSADCALHVAWRIWFTLAVIPFIVFLAVIWQLMDAQSEAGNSDLAQTWFIGAMAYLAIGLPAAFFWRSRIFRGYWAGKTISPRDYLVGMATIWIAIEIGGLFALIGCLVSGTLLPNLLPALVAFMLFTPLWPNGHSMTRPLHNEQDPAEYQEPR